MVDMNSDISCVFCGIVNGTIPAHKIYEDDETLAFLDISPVNKGHVLVIPKDHHENVYDMPAETWCRVMIMAQKVAIAVKNALDADGINISMNNESAAGQEIFHAHIHIIPRYNDDGLSHWPHKKYDDEGEKESVVEKIKTLLADSR
jgi:histidine triad (HIT) family protein